MLRAGELDMALVGAVDLSCEPVHEAALASVTGAVRSAGDAAVVCVLMRASSARAAGLPCIALLDTVPVLLRVERSLLTPRVKASVSVAERCCPADTASLRAVSA